MKKAAGELIKKVQNPTQGQGLVEMAIIAPILIFFLLGVFEVGWALRGYLVLLNANREVTRFAIRPNYLDFSNKDPDYRSVLTHTITTLSGQLPMDFSTNSSALIISHLVVDTGLPCKQDVLDAGDCDCGAFANPPYADEFSLDDLILYPGLLGFDYYTHTFPTTGTFQTRLDYAQLVEDLAQQNNEFNCQLLQGKIGVVPSANNVIVTELYYEQPQLFGFPLISNPLTDPVPLYSNTTMRIVAQRGGDNTTAVGPVCIAYPWAVGKDRFDTFTEGQVVDTFDVWLLWNSAFTGDPQAYVEDALRYPRISFNDFTETGGGPIDGYLNKGDQVATAGAVNPDRDLVLALKDKEIVVPVLDLNNQIVDFIKVKVADNVDNPDDRIEATYMGLAPECQ